jgi:type I restriction enzyme S subunit
MSTETKNKLEPRLRFPEFQNAGEWEVKKVGDIFEVTRGYVLPMSLVKEKQDNENLYPVYSSQTKNNGLAGFYKEYLYENAITWTTDGANAGDVNYREGKFYCTNVCGVLINKSGFANKCIAELINSVSRKYVSYVGNPKLMNGVMSEIKIPVPSLPEQQKIASCLSSLDEVITGEQQKLELLKQHKKGLLQNLFPQEGETVPKLRFKEFENSGEWEVKKLGEVCEINPSISKLPKEFIYIDLESVKDGQLFQTKKISIDNAPSRAQRLLRKNDIIFQMVRPYQRNNLLFNLDGFNYVASTGYAQLRTSQSPEFLYYQLHTDFFVFRVLEKCTGTNYPAINTEELTKIEVFVPSLPEQQKIAACLSSLDDLITAQTQKIEQLQRHKKGLLQGLFPNMNEQHG